MLRTSCRGDSSNAKNKQRSPRLQAACTKRAATLVLPDPGVPETSTVLPLKYPPPSMASSRGMPLDTRVGDALCCSPSEVIGRTEKPVVVDQEGILVRAVRGAPVLHDPHTARGDLPRDPVVEQDHAVRDVFFEPVPGEGARAPLGRDDGRDPAGFQPAEQAPQLRAQQAGVRQAREQALDGVEHHALGADGVDGVAQADEQSLEVVLPRLLDLGALDVHEVDEELLLGARGARGRSPTRRRSGPAPRPSPRRP